MPAAVSTAVADRNEAFRFAAPLPETRFEEYARIEYGGLPVNYYAVLHCAPSLRLLSAPAFWSHVLPNGVVRMHE